MHRDSALMINFYLYNIRSNSDDLRCLLRTSGYYLLRRNDACTVLFVVIGVHEILNIAVEQCVCRCALLRICSTSGDKLGIVFTC